MLKKIIAIAFFIFICLPGSKLHAQDVALVSEADMIAKVEDTLVLMADSMYTAFIPDARPAYCEQFVRKLVQVLKSPNSYNYPFNKLKDKVSIIYPEDKSFRIFNWVITPSNVTKRYYGAIQLPGDKLKLYPLIDHSNEFGAGIGDSILTNTRWYGALYYRIITHMVEGKPVYTLFGLNSANTISNKKLMEPMTLTPQGPVFGASIFSINSMGGANEYLKRFVLEYKKEVQVSLNWDNDLNAVYFDRLVSQINDPNRKYTFVPSGEYDGFKWTNDLWTFVRDLIAVQVLKDNEAPTPSPIKAQE